jgi:RNA polymerase sigma factor (sigma-70 family)
VGKIAWRPLATFGPGHGVPCRPERPPRPDREAAVSAALEELSPRQREAVRLVYWRGLTPTEAAGRMLVSKQRVAQLLDAARLRLARLLRAFGGD